MTNIAMSLDGKRVVVIGGASGIGAYHGERGFLTFTHQKPVFIQSRLSFTWLLRPPYGKRFERVLALLKKIA